MGDQQKPVGAGEKSESDATQIDLGQDLLEKLTQSSSFGAEIEAIAKPAHYLNQGPGSPLQGQSSGLVFPLSGKHENSLTPDRIPEAIENARILFREGFTEDAKKILHQVLILNSAPLLGSSHSGGSGSVVVRQILAEIHEFELKQIFGEGEIRRNYGNRANRFGEMHEDFFEEVRGGLSSEELMKKLDRDLHLGISDWVPFFENSEKVDDFCRSLELDLKKAQATSKDWLDLGVAFLEMELFPVAERLFISVGRQINPDFKDESKMDPIRLSAACLLALSLILSDRSYEAISGLQPLLRDPDLKNEEKIEVFYLIGRAYESMKKFDLASQYYQQVREVDANYRDIVDRLNIV